MIFILAMSLLLVTEAQADTSPSVAFQERLTAARTCGPNDDEEMWCTFKLDDLELHIEVKRNGRWAIKGGTEYFIQSWGQKCIMIYQVLVNKNSEGHIDMAGFFHGTPGGYIDVTTGTAWTSSYPCFDDD